jgi:hypothetical protein
MHTDYVSHVMVKTQDPLLKSFMQEFFPFSECLKIKFFTKEMRGDYEAQAKRVCWFFGYKTVYEHGAKEIRGHLSFDTVEARGNEPFVTVIPSIYD